MAAKTKLELTWIGKDIRPRLEPRILIEETEFSHHAKARREGDSFENLLIHGDNLLALKARENGIDLATRAPEDLPVLAALVQDAVFPITEMTYARPRRRFAILLNRFRWEDAEAAKTQNRRFERVQSLLVFEGVLAVKTTGLDRAARDTVLSLLSISFAEDGQGGGTVTLVLAGDGAIALQIEALDASLRDMTFRGASLEAVREHSLSTGALRPLVNDGARKVLDGITTVTEVLRVSSSGA